MAITYLKAKLAALREQPPQPPRFTKGLYSWAEKRSAILAFRVALRRWEKIRDTLGGYAASYQQATNGPAEPGKLHGHGTLTRGQASSTIVHTQPNRQQRRDAGSSSVAAHRRRTEQLLAAAEARESIARGTFVHGRWRPADPGDGGNANGHTATAVDDL